MASTFNIIEYISGLTTYALDEAIIKRIAMDRNVMDYTDVEDLTQKDKDLLLADVLFAVFCGPNTIASFQHQHGQFSTSTGSQKVDEERIYLLLRRLYGKWGDDKVDLIPESSLSWMD